MTREDALEVALQTPHLDNSMINNIVETFVEQLTILTMAIDEYIHI